MTHERGTPDHTERDLTPSKSEEAEVKHLSKVMHLDVIRTPMEAGTIYHLAGVLNYGSRRSGVLAGQADCGARVRAWVRPP
jgi:hypothetical protein